MSFVLKTARRTKIVATQTALSGFIQPAFPPPLAVIHPHPLPVLAGRIIFGRTHLPASSTSVTPPPVFVESIKAAIRPQVAGRIVSRHTPFVNGTLGLPAGNTIIVKARPIPIRRGGFVSIHTPIPPINAPSASQVRPRVVKAAKPPLKAGRITVPTWTEFGSQARPAVVVKPGKTVARGRFVATRCATPPNAVPVAHPVVVHAPAVPKVPGKIARARTPLVNGTLGLSPTNPAIVRAARRLPITGHVTASSAAGPQPRVGQPRILPSVVKAAVATLRRPGAILATHMPGLTQITPRPATVVKAGRIRALPSAGRIVATLHAPQFSAPPIPKVVVVSAGKSPLRPGKLPTILGTAKLAGVQTVTPRPVSIRPGKPPLRPGTIRKTSLPAGPQPNTRSTVVKAANKPPIAAPDVVVERTPLIRLIVPPRGIIVPGGKPPRVAGHVLKTMPGIASPILHGPMPRAIVVPAGRYPAPRAGRSTFTFTPFPYPVSGLPPDLPAAIMQWLRQNPTVVAAFGDTATTPKFFGDKATWNKLPEMPYLVYDEIYEGPGLYESADDRGITHLFPEGQFQIAVFTKQKIQGRNLARMLKNVLNDAPLTFEDGILLELRWSEEMSMVADGSPGQGSAPTYYQRVVTFLYRVQREMIQPT